MKVRKYLVDSKTLDVYELDTSLVRNHPIDYIWLVYIRRGKMKDLNSLDLAKLIDINT